LGLLSLFPLEMVAQVAPRLPDLIVSTENDSIACNILENNFNELTVELEYDGEIQEAVVQREFVKTVIENFYVTGQKPLVFEHKEPEVPTQTLDPIKETGFRLGIAAGYAHRLSNSPASYFTDSRDVNGPLRSGYFTKVRIDYFLSEGIGIGIHHTLNRSNVSIGNVAFTILDQSLNPISTYDGTWQEQITIQTIGLALSGRTFALNDQLEVIGMGSFLYARVEDRVSNIMDAAVISDNIAFNFGFQFNYHIQRNFLFNITSGLLLGQVAKGRTQTSDPILERAFNPDQIKSISRFDIGAGFIYTF